MDAAIHISDAEWEIMNRLWDRAPQTAQELSAEMAGVWGESTVKTLLNRLVRKGALSYQVAGKAYRYSPAVSRDDCRSKESASFLERVFDGATGPMLAHFVESSRLSEAELAELERLVRQKRKKS